MSGNTGVCIVEREESVVDLRVVGIARKSLQHTTGRMNTLSVVCPHRVFNSLKTL